MVRREEIDLGNDDIIIEPRVAGARILGVRELPAADAAILSAVSAALAGEVDHWGRPAGPAKIHVSAEHRPALRAALVPAADDGYFFTSTTLQAVVDAAPDLPLLIRCGSGRELVPARAVAARVAWIDAGPDYVRDVSLPAYVFDDLVELGVLA